MMSYRQSIIIIEDVCIYVCLCVFVCVCVCLYAWMHSDTVGDIETKPSQVAGGFSAGGRRVGGGPEVAGGQKQKKFAGHLKKLPQRIRVGCRPKNLAAGWGIFMQWS